MPYQLMSICMMLQPDNPAALSGKIYEMMSSAIAGKWSSQSHGEPSFPQHAAAAPHVEPDTVEAEVVEPEPVESGQQK
jgi:heat shock protein beta